MGTGERAAWVVGADDPGRCVVCDRVSALVVWRENGYEGRACRCGTVYATPTPPPGAVDPTVDGHPDSYYALPARRRVRWIQRYRPRGRVLDVGCGEGHFLAAAQAAGYDVAGIEPHPGRARRAAARLGAPVECALLESCRPGKAEFDIVYHCDLLSHFADPIAALRKMRGFLGPDGVLAFEVGLLGGIAPWWYTTIGTLGYPQHRWLYSARSLRRLLARADLELARTAHFGLAPGTLFLAGVRSLARRYRRLRGATQRPGPPAAAARSSVTRFVDRTESFWRYTVGRLAPRVGPATLFAIARPRQGAMRHGHDVSVLSAPERRG
jgi:SAM-dependent methyltransferase